VTLKKKRNLYFQMSEEREDDESINDAIRAMEERMISLRAKFTQIGVDMSHLPRIITDEEAAQPSQRIVLQHQYARLHLEHDKLWQTVEMMNNGLKNPFAVKQVPPLIYANDANEDGDISLFDIMPDLCLHRLVHFLDSPADIKALFQALTFRTRVEREFCKRLRECYRDRMALNDTFFTDCKGEWCRFPTTCPRCFLYGKGLCLRCKKDAQLRFDEAHRGSQCDNLVTTQATGISVPCRELVQCPTCRFMYHPDEAAEVVRIRDFDCVKYPTREGCIYCTTECKWCANIGCDHPWHFQVNPDVYSVSDAWKECQQCGHPHCCRVFTWFYRERTEEEQLQDGGVFITHEKMDFEWDELACPQWDRLSPAEPRRKKTRVIVKEEDELKKPKTVAPIPRRRILVVPHHKSHKANKRKLTY
jgi:hypothetical protein